MSSITTSYCSLWSRMGSRLGLVSVSTFSKCRLRKILAAFNKSSLSSINNILPLLTLRIVVFFKPGDGRPKTGVGLGAACLPEAGKDDIEPPIPNNIPNLVTGLIYLFNGYYSNDNGIFPFSVSSIFFKNTDKCAVFRPPADEIVRNTFSTFL